MYLVFIWIVLNGQNMFYLSIFVRSKMDYHESQRKTQDLNVLVHVSKFMDAINLFRPNAFFFNCFINALVTDRYCFHVLKCLWLPCIKVYNSSWKKPYQLYAFNINKCTSIIQLYEKTVRRWNAYKLRLS